MASACDENFLLDLSKELSVEDLEGLKYVSSDFIPRRETEDVASEFKLLDLLEQDGRITRDNLSLLEQMLEAIKRADLAWKVQQFASVDANTAANVGMSIDSRIFPARDLAQDKLHENSQWYEETSPLGQLSTRSRPISPHQESSGLTLECT